MSSEKPDENAEDCRRLSLLAGPSVCFFFPNVEGKRVLLLGEKHSTQHVIPPSFLGHAYDVHRWLADLAAAAPSCLDVMIEILYGPLRPQRSVPVGRLDLYRSPLVAVEHILLPCSPPDIPRKNRDERYRPLGDEVIEGWRDEARTLLRRGRETGRPFVPSDSECFRDNKNPRQVVENNRNVNDPDATRDICRCLRYRHLNLSTLAANSPLASLFFLYGEDAYDDAGHSIEATYHKQRRQLFDYATTRDQSPETEQLFRMYLEDLARGVTSSTGVQIEEAARIIEAGDIWSLWTHFYSGYRAHIHKLRDRLPCDWNTFAAVFSAVCAAEPEIAPVLWAVPMDICCLLELFAEPQNDERSRCDRRCGCFVGPAAARTQSNQHPDNSLGRSTDDQQTQTAVVNGERHRQEGSTCQFCQRPQPKINADRKPPRCEADRTAPKGRSPAKAENSKREPNRTEPKGQSSGEGRNPNRSEPKSRRATGGRAETRRTTKSGQSEPNPGKYRREERIGRTEPQERRADRFPRLARVPGSGAAQAPATAVSPTEKRNVIIMTGANHSVRYRNFIEWFSGAVAVDFSQDDPELQYIVFDSPFDFFA